MLINDLPTIKTIKTNDEVPIERGTNLYKTTLNALLIELVKYDEENEMLVLGADS